jgi:hypothetical protein
VAGLWEDHGLVFPSGAGHGDVSLTLNVYSHVLPDMGDTVAGAMDDALG